MKAEGPGRTRRDADAGMSTGGTRTLLDCDGASAGYGTARAGDNGDMPAIGDDVETVAAALGAAGDGRTAAALRGVVNGRNGRLYASRPRNGGGECRYLWRMLAFFLSAKAEHQCMPVTADDEVGPAYERGESVDDLMRRARARRKRCKELDEVVKQVVDRVPVRQQHGALRWARALGA